MFTTTSLYLEITRTWRIVLSLRHCTLVHPVPYCQLRYGLLPVNILRLYTLIIKPFDGNKLTTAGLAFIALATMLETIFYRRETATIKAFFA